MAASSRRYLVPLIAAIAVLGALAGVIGWQLGVRDSQSTGDGPTDSPSQTSSSPSVIPCPTVTQEAAHQAGAPSGVVSIVMYVRTARAEAWICRDGAGKLYYQGHVGDLTKQNFPATSTQTIFLSTVVLKSDGSYVATNQTKNGTTTYTVSSTKLVVTNNNGVVTANDDVISTTPPR